MLSAARSRLAIPSQFVFLVVNGIGILTSVVYDASTPDLYANNAHHKIGWAVTWIAVVWVLLGLFNYYVQRLQKAAHTEFSTNDTASQTVAHYRRLQDYNLRQDCRWSDDSGHGTERNSTSICADSRSPSSEEIYHKPEQPQQPYLEDNDDEDDQGHAERRGFLDKSSMDRLFPIRISQALSDRASTAIDITYVVLERFQVILGFLAITTGLITWTGLFNGLSVMNGLAHWIKGGMFFWFGILTLGRWMGAFTDFGWAWNVRPEYPLVTKFASKMPSAEFGESFVIFLYGATNVFLEHLAAWGSAWTAGDLEHLSITVMFFGGGLLGMLIESETIRNLLNTNMLVKKASAGPSHGDSWDTPKTYKTSLNPVPGLVIMLLGIMMSSHHQDSMVSTMVHKQWGTLFVGLALSRAVTYILLYISPPASHFPSRPPSELVTAFCSISGGLLFMASARDVVETLEYNDLDAMFVFTVMMGLTCLVMAWTTVLYAFKGWAFRRENRGSVRVATD